MIMADSFIKIIHKNFPQTLLEECKYKIKNYKMKSPIDYAFDSDSSDDSNNDRESESDSKSDNDSDSNESDKNVSDNNGYV